MDQMKEGRLTEISSSKAVLDRLAPVLMTALTTGLGLVPLVIGGHLPGKEILFPVATVILGGLISATIAEFAIRPGIFGFCTTRIQSSRCSQNRLPKWCIAGLPELTEFCHDCRFEFGVYGVQTSDLLQFLN